MESSCHKLITSLLNKELESYILLVKVDLPTNSTTLSPLAQSNSEESLKVLGRDLEVQPAEAKLFWT